MKNNEHILQKGQKSSKRKFKVKKVPKSADERLHANNGMLYVSVVIKLAYAVVSVYVRLLKIL